MPTESALTEEIFFEIYTSDNQSAMCNQLSVARSTYHRYKKRYEEEGKNGLICRSTRPHGSPSRLSKEISNRIIRLAKSGKYTSANQIHIKLKQEGRNASVKTIIKILDKNCLYKRNEQIVEAKTHSKNKIKMVRRIKARDA